MCVLLLPRPSHDLLGFSPLGLLGCRNAVISAAGSTFCPCTDGFPDAAALSGTVPPATAPSASLVLLASLIGLSTNGAAAAAALPFFGRCCSPPQPPPPLASSGHDVFLGDDGDEPRISSLEAPPPAAVAAAVALVAAETMLRIAGEENPAAAPPPAFLPLFDARTDGERRPE